MNSVDKSLMIFPCQFPIKIVGHNDPELLAAVLEIINTQFPEITRSQLLTRNSKDNNYLSMTVTVTAMNQQQLDAVYQMFTKHDKIIMAL